MKRAKTQLITTDQLREFWRAQIEVFDEITNLLEAQRERGKLSKPQRIWLVMMQSWRGELVRLLTEFPGTQHALEAGRGKIAARRTDALGRCGGTPIIRDWYHQGRAHARAARVVADVIFKSRSSTLS